MVRDMKILQELVDSERTSFYTENFHAIDLAIKKLLKRLKDLKYIEQEHKEINGQLRQRVKELEEENKEFYEGEKFTAKQVKKFEESRNKHYIHKSVIEEKIKEYLEYDRKYKTYTKDGRENFTMEYFKAGALEELIEEGSTNG